MTKKYKKGDRVRITAVDEDSWWFKVGQEGTVTSGHAGSTYTYCVDIDGGGALNPAYVYYPNIVLIPPTPSFAHSFSPGGMPDKAAALQTQVGGTHYTDMAIQPATFNLANGLGWAEGDAVSYISRWRKKGGLQDLRKARQTLLLLIEHEEALGTE